MPDQPTRDAEVLPRRRFLKGLLGFSILSTIAMVLAPVASFLMPRKTTVASGGRVLVGTTTTLDPSRGKVVALGSKPVIVVSGPTGIKAFSAVCTHLGCIVGYDSNQSPDIVSPCHDGHFSTVDGRVISGHPPAPLKEYQVLVDKEQIYVQAG